MSSRFSFISLGIMIVLLLAVDIFLLMQTISLKKEVAIKDAVITNLGAGQSLTSYLETNLLFSLKYNGSRFPGSSLEDGEGNVTDTERFGKSPVLVYRFNEHDCLECINFGLFKLSNFADNGAFPVLVMARFEDMHLFRRWALSDQFPGIEVYNMSSIIAQDAISAPYFFMLHEDMTVGELFIPEKSSPKQTNIYLETIREKYYKPN